MKAGFALWNRSYAFTGIKGRALLQRFDECWGPLAYFKDVYLNVIPNPQERVEGFWMNPFILVNGPWDVETLCQAGVQVKFPCFRVSFLVLNQRNLCKMCLCVRPLI